MKKGSLAFITAIFLSIIAEYYSVLGLAQIFTGATISVIILGATLGLAKLVTISWLYRNWKSINILMKSYMLIAVFILMMITSMGIFGFLSRAHMESSSQIGGNTVQLQILETQEKIAKDRLDYLLKRAGDPATASRKLDAQIQEAQKELTKISEQKLPLKTEENKLMAEIGPLKYIAEILYDKNDTEFIDKAVRFVIFMIIFVFDPLAILLLIASQKSFTEEDRKRSRKTNKQQIIPDDFEMIPKKHITVMSKNE